MNHTDPHWHSHPLQSESEVQWVSSVTRTMPRPRNQLQPMLHFEADVAASRVASAANQFRFHLQFYSRCRFEEDREEEGSLRFGGIFGNQSLDVIVGHINSALASQQCCIY